jgi:regulator of protease activity HflC (stomatin/prohibitin superfamily)
MEWLPYAIGAVLIIVIFYNIRIVSQATEVVVERLGKYRKTWGAGVHLLIPLIEKAANRVTLKEQVLDTPPQPVITADNVTMQIDAVVYFRIFDAKLYTYGVVNPVEALTNLTATTLRNIVGELSLDQSLTSRDTINSKMSMILDTETDPWGIKVVRVEVKNIMPPSDIREAMEAEMRAERTRRETLLQAEGHKQAAITRAEGDKRAMVLQAEGERDARIARAEGEARAVYLAKKAEADGIRELVASAPTSQVLELKQYEALVAMCNGRAAKIIVPTDAVKTVSRNVLFSETTGLGDATKEAPAEPAEAAKDPCCNDADYREAHASDTAK